MGGDGFLPWAYYKKKIKIDVLLKEVYNE
ncbi:hypothetical protein CK1_12710 [Ruminococcus sp. SR1/5]|nr:hypothetical protein CK1_12710 [Ruminococcus sp. SR1/5]